jgi:hypothetical protein
VVQTCGPTTWRFSTCVPFTTCVPLKGVVVGGIGSGGGNTESAGPPKRKNGTGGGVSGRLTGGRSTALRIGMLTADVGRISPATSDMRPTNLRLGIMLIVLLSLKYGCGCGMKSVSLSGVGHFISCIPDFYIFTHGCVTPCVTVYFRDYTQERPNLCLF